MYMYRQCLTSLCPGISVRNHDREFTSFNSIVIILAEGGDQSNDDNKSGSDVSFDKVSMACLGTLECNVFYVLPLSPLVQMRIILQI